jgi:hypothetical protein
MLLDCSITACKKMALTPYYLHVNATLQDFCARGQASGG